MKSFRTFIVFIITICVVLVQAFLCTLLGDVGYLLLMLLGVLDVGLFFYILEKIE